MRGTIRRSSAVLLLFIILLLAPSATSRLSQQRANTPLQTALSDFASRAAQAIERNAKSPARLLVLDFSEASPSQFGLEVASQISGFLAAKPSFIVVDRSNLPDLYARDRIPAEEFRNHEAMTCYARELGADIVIEGEIYVSSGAVVIQSDVRRMRDHEMLFTSQSAALPITTEIRAEIEMPRSFSAVSPDDYSSEAKLPKANENGFSRATCLYCPQPQFPDEAVKLIADGKLLLALELDSGGSPTKVTVLQGAPCGFNRAAVDAARTWRLKPAEGPDGKPTAVWTPVDMRFHLY